MTKRDALESLPRQRLMRLAYQFSIDLQPRARKHEIVDELAGSRALSFPRILASLDHDERTRIEVRLGRPLPHATDIVARAGEQADGLRQDQSGAHKKKWGQYFTGEKIANFMAGLIEVPGNSRVRVLDPGAGTGILGLALVRRLLSDAGVEHVELVSVEQECGAFERLQAMLDVGKRELGPRLSVRAMQADVLGLATPQLGSEPLPAFDLVISNPPYFKLPPSQRRGGDAPNIYARFMEVAASLLAPGGRLCFIIPRSYASGCYFKRFRRRFHEAMQLERVHVFESRSHAFRVDKVLQENIIVVYRKGSAQPGDAVRVSSSAGVDDLDDLRGLLGPRELLAPVEGDAVLSLPTSEADLALMTEIRRWPNTLAALGLEVSTGPVVPFRAREVLADTGSAATAPLLWLQHVRPNEVCWPLGEAFRKREHIRRDADGKLLVPNRNYVVLRRFSAKEEARRLTAAPLLREQLDAEVLGLENHLNYIHRPGGELGEDEARGLAALLNSELLDRYFRISSGNTQVSATELRALPLPEAELLAALGRERDGGVAAMLEEALA